MKAQDKDKTALFIPLGQYQFTRMPFGLKNAPATFSRLVDSLFEDKHGFVANYIYDVAIFSQDWKTHIEHLRQVFTTLKDAKLTLRNAKCLLGADYCDFLGHTIGGGKIEPNEG